MRLCRVGLVWTCVLSVGAFLVLACGPDAGEPEAVRDRASENEGTRYTRTDTHIVESYEMQGMLTQLFSTRIVEPASGYGFEWDEEAGELITDVSFGWTGDGTCKLYESDVDCRDDVESLQVSYRRYSFKPAEEGEPVMLRLYHHDNEPVDYTLDLLYPSSLTYISSTLTPDLDWPGHLRWNVPDMTEFESLLTFRYEASRSYRGLWFGLGGLGLAAIGALHLAIWLKRRGRNRAGAAAT